MTAPAPPGASVAARPIWKGRLAALAAILLLALGTVVARLAWLQLHLGEALAARAEDARRRVELVRPRRGEILDRLGRVLAEERPVHTLGVRLLELDRGTEIAPRVARWVRLPRGELVRAWDALVDEARADPGGPPLPLVTAPGEASQRMFARLAAGEPGVALSGSALLVDRALLLRPDRVLDALARIAGLDLARVRARVLAEREAALAFDNPLERAARLDAPVEIADEVPYEVACRVEERLPVLPGADVSVRGTRRYPYGEVAGHVIGYLGPLTPDEARALRADGRLLNLYQGAKLPDGPLGVREDGRFYDDRLGRVGLEARCEDLLKGAPGVRWVERDRRTGASIVLWEAPPRAGQDVRTTIDIGLQAEAEAALDEAIARVHAKGGAAVVVDAETGAVHALASSPRYDPGALRARYRELIEDPRRPLLHRAIAAAVPPASTVKPLLGLDALARHPLVGDRPFDERTRFHCRGYLHTWGRFQCDGVHGDVALGGALSHSCNVFFYCLGETLGEAGLLAAFHRFGLGAETGLGLTGESAGALPSTRARRRRLARARAAAREAARVVRRGEAEAVTLALLGPTGAMLLPAHGRRLAEARDRARRASAAFSRARAEASWRKGDSRNTAIGQGELTATPAQIARAAAALATGSLPRLRLIEDDPIESVPLAVSPGDLAIVAQGMRDTVTRGTARLDKLVKRQPVPREAAEVFCGSAFAKTGTAQAGERNHAWIMGWVPAPPGAPHGPLAFAVLLEHADDGVHGGDGAGPAAALIIEAALRHLSEPAP